MHSFHTLSRSLYPQLRAIERPLNVPDSGLVCDILWADPEEVSTATPDHLVVHISHNEHFISHHIFLEIYIQYYLKVTLHESWVHYNMYCLQQNIPRANPQIFLLPLTRTPVHASYILPQDVRGWAPNDRGVSWTFGGDVLRAFLEHHNLSLVVRAHQVCKKQLAS